MAAIAGVMAHRSSASMSASGSMSSPNLLSLDVPSAPGSLPNVCDLSGGTGSGNAPQSSPPRGGNNNNSSGNKSGSSSNLKKQHSSSSPMSLSQNQFGSLKLSDEQVQDMQKHLTLGVQVSELELENIRRIFREFDADGSNSIDVDELALVMQSLGVRMDEKQLLELVEQVTDEGETELSFEEFVSLITLWKEAAQYKLFDGAGMVSLAKQHVDAALQSSSYVPDKPVRAAWDIGVAVVAVLYWIFCLLLDAYPIDDFDWRGLLAGDIVCTIFLAIDIAVCAQTAFTRDGRTIDGRQEVRENYMRTWMIPDVVAALPFDLVLTAAGAPLAATIFRHLRLLKVLKLPYLWRNSEATPITSGYITFHFHLLPIFQLLIAFFIMVHGFAVGWIMLKQNVCADSASDTAIVRTNRTVMVLNETTGNLTATTAWECYYPYTPAVYFIIYSLSTVGLGDVSVSGEAEYWYACLVLVGAMASNGIVIGKLVQILQRADIKKEQRSKIRETLAVLEHYHIASQLQTEILQFQAHVFENNLGAAYESIISGLPAEMRTNISLFVRMKLVSVVPLFRESHFMLRIAVAQVLTNAVARPEQYICVAGQQLNGLFFLAYGFIDSFDEKGQYVSTLRSGDYFGEESLVGSGVVKESVKALTFCDLWILQGETFNHLLRKFPKFMRKVELLRSVHREVEEVASAGGSFAVRRRSSSVAAESTASSAAAAGGAAGTAAGDDDEHGEKGGKGESRSEMKEKHQQQQRKSMVTFQGGYSSNNAVLGGVTTSEAAAAAHHPDGPSSVAASNMSSSSSSSSSSSRPKKQSPESPPQLQHPTMSVSEIHDFVHKVRNFKEKLKNAEIQPQKRK